METESEKELDDSQQLRLVLQSEPVQSTGTDAGGGASVRAGERRDHESRSTAGGAIRIFTDGGQKRHQQLCGRRELSQQLRADLEFTGTERPAGPPGDRGELPGHERHAAGYFAGSESGGAWIGPDGRTAAADRERRTISI